MYAGIPCGLRRDPRSGNLGAFNWEQLWKGVEYGTGVFKTYLTLRPPEGTAVSLTPQGTQVYRTTPEGVGPVQFLPPIGGTSIGTLILVGGLIVVGLMFATRGRK